MCTKHATNECSILAYLEGSAHQLQLLGDVAGLVHLQHSASGSYPELRLGRGWEGRGGGVSRSDTQCTTMQASW